MTEFSKPQAVEIAAIDAVRTGRKLAESWPEAAVENISALDPLLRATFERFAAGEVFSSADDHSLAMMLASIRATLDSYRTGYGAFFLREHTGQDPFFDPDRDRVRRLGELLKGFIAARQSVIDAIMAERQIMIMRRR